MFTPLVNVSSFQPIARADDEVLQSCAEAELARRGHVVTDWKAEDRTEVWVLAVGRCCWRMCMTQEIRSGILCKHTRVLARADSVSPKAGIACALLSLDQHAGW